MRKMPHQRDERAGLPSAVAVRVGQAGDFSKGRIRSMASLPVTGVALVGIGAALLAASGSPAKAATIELINASPATIDRFYVATCRSRHWGPDLTHARSVPPGGKF